MPDWGVTVKGTFANTVPMIGTVEDAVTEGVTVTSGVLVCEGVMGTQVTA
jgi:hypothetical protein